MGQMRWNSKNDNKFKSVVSKFKDGLAFTMTKAPFVADAKKQHAHTPIQAVVNLAEAQMSPSLNNKETKHYPEPPATIAECSHISNDQQFDITALVKSVGKYRTIIGNRVVFDVELIDGSKDTDKVRTMSVSVFTDGGLGSNPPPTWSCAKKASERAAAHPMRFFRIKGAQDDNNLFSFTTTEHSVIIEAASAKKGTHLVAEASALLSLSDTDSFAMRNYEDMVPRDFSAEPATETMRALFLSIANKSKTGFDTIDNVEETLWQLNWVHVVEPPAGSNIRANCGKRLWFPVTVRDCTGVITAYMQESAALKLSGIDNAEQFDSFRSGGVVVPSNMLSENHPPAETQRCTACGLRRPATRHSHRGRLGAGPLQPADGGVCSSSASSLF